MLIQTVLDAPVAHLVPSAILQAAEAPLASPAQLGLITHHSAKHRALLAKQERTTRLQAARRLYLAYLAKLERIIPSWAALRAHLASHAQRERTVHYLAARRYRLALHALLEPTMRWLAVPL